ncbi:MAG: ABC transporter ATP-binding protein [Phycisphaerales bacterium]|nr:ABC transporter ATP-binding protein [Phycisphaerales bacterium]
MSSDPHAAPTNDATVLRVEQVSKQYRIYRRPRDRLLQALTPWRARWTGFWALRDVSIEVKRGQAWGILGRNGAGKSTLLQLIAGTVAPTRGRVEVRGRVAAMLELGSGFNPEFTGRENVFLAGAILGIARREMERRFDEIAAFADIGAFLEQPLKTYSSGMAARLAFAVAFSVEPDILIVDEVLAVGDAAFQHRCLARLRRLRDNGLTLLFVSHNADAVRSTCTHGLVLADGTAVCVDSAERAVDHYLRLVREHVNQEAIARDATLAAGGVALHPERGSLAYGTGQARIEIVRVLDEQGRPCALFDVGQQVTVEVALKAAADVRDLSVSFFVRDATGVDLLGTTTFDERVELPALRAGEILRVRFTFENRLHHGSFGIGAAVTRVTLRDYSDVVLLEQVDAAAAFNTSYNPQRPVHYKVHEPVGIVIDRADPHAEPG